MKKTTLMVLAFSALVATPALAKQMTPREIYKTYGKAVVLVFATDGSAQGSAGTGSIITAEGEVITNAHVVAHEGTPYKKIFVYLKPDKLVGSMKDDLKDRYKATIVDIDANLDLALLKIENPPADLVTIPFVDPDTVEIGEPVVAIGHPETGGLWTLTTGSISSVVKDFAGIEGKDVFQTEASVNRGNSGGPLLNAYGQMVGINTCISRRAADGLAITSINFSLKSSVPVEWMKRRKLMTLAYVKPDDPAAAATTVAQNDTSQGEVKAIPQKDEAKVVAAVEPKKGEDVADDPEFNKAAEAQTNVSSTATIKKNGNKEEAVKPKRLTKSRPYKLEPFVSERMREIKALEKDMEDMSNEIDRRRGNKGKKVDTSGNGLW
jgi:serine protease Do